MNQSMYKQCRYCGFGMLVDQEYCGCLEERELRGEDWTEEELADAGWRKHEPTKPAARG